MQGCCFKWVRPDFADAKRHPRDAPVWCTVGQIAICFKMENRGDSRGAAASLRRSVAVSSFGAG
jgi:hypothetical protein